MFRQELRQAVRMLWRNPGDSLIALLTLTLGIGVNSAVFSVVSAALLRPLPYPDQDSLLDVLVVRFQSPETRRAISPADFLAWRSQNTSFKQLGAYQVFGAVDLTGEGDPMRLVRHRFSEGYLEALGVQASSGRLFFAEDYLIGSDEVVLLHYDLWFRQFGLDPAVVGRQISLDGRSYTVVGVLSKDFRTRGGVPDVVMPLRFSAADGSDRRSASLGAVGRLKPGVTLARAEADLDSIAVALGEIFPETNKELRASLVPLREVYVSGSRTALLILFASVGFVLLLACTHVANLQLARAISRGQEVVLRLALGANFGRLVRQFMTESCLLALLGGLLSIPMAYLTLQWLPDARGVYLNPDLEIGVDGLVILFAFGLSLLAGVVSGAIPAIQAARGDLYTGLKASGRVGGGGQKWQGIFVICQVAMAFVLVITAGLILRSFVRLQEVELGFDPADAVVFQLTLPESRYVEQELVVGTISRLSERLKALPGVSFVGTAKEIPPDRPWTFTPVLKDQEESEAQKGAGWFVVSGEYFQAMGTPVVAGRSFDSRDHAENRLTMLLNESAARTFFANRDPLGAEMRFNGKWFQIVGIVADQQVPGAGNTSSSAVYVHASQFPVPAGFLRSFYVILRTDPSLSVAASASLSAPIRDEVWALDNALPVANIQSLKERLALAPSFAQPRYIATLLGLFSILGLLLAFLGIFGVVSFVVNKRRFEFGIRMTLGATQSHIFGLVLKTGMGLTLIGSAVGVLLALGFNRLLTNMLYAVESWDPLTFGSTFFLVASSAALACFLPAWRAGKVQPIEVIRSE